jgi:ApbE superfamily uncharacterized protein (UPF0280 family)
MKESRFSWKKADYRIFSDKPSAVKNAIKKLRSIIEEYISANPKFGSALEPVETGKNVPAIISVMHNASVLTGTGPMASVAGAIARFAAEEAFLAGSTEAVVENGGDIYLICRKEIITGLYAGDNKIAGNLAFKIRPELMPVAVCSSSSYMGHSLSLGRCDLATVISKDAALADAAATKACNMVKSVRNIELTLNKLIEIPGINGILIVKDDSIGMIGELPEIIRNKDEHLKNKITKHKSISFI